MNRLIIFVCEDCYHEFLLEDTIFMNEQLEVVSEADAAFSFRIRNNMVYYDQYDCELEYNKNYTHNNRTFFIMKSISKTYALKGIDKVKIGNTENDHLILLERFPFHPMKEKERLGTIYKNGIKIPDENISVEEGDWLLIGHLKIVIEKDYIEVIGDEKLYQTNLNFMEQEDVRFEGFPFYKRSPRMLKNIPTEKISILNPPSKATRDKKTLAKIIIPPIVTLSVTLLISIVQPRGIYIIMSVIGTTMSVIFSIITYVEDKNDTHKKNTARDQVYTDYILKLRKNLHNLKSEQVEALTYNNPDLPSIDKMVRRYSGRIYERSVGEEDFLSIAIGKTDIKPSYSMTNNFSELEMEKDELTFEAEEVYDNFNLINNMPITVELKKTHFGFVGEKTIIHEQLMLLFAQLTFEHSYEDIEIIFLYEDQYRDKFECLKWYPHFKVNEINVTGLVYDERVKNQVFDYATQVLKKRKQQIEKENRGAKYLPHFVFVIDDVSMIAEHSIMEFIHGKDSNLGFSIIYTTNNQSNLPENIKTVFTLDDSNSGHLVLNNGLVCNQAIHLNRINGVDMEQIARTLSSIVYAQGVSNYIPESITFFEMYQIEHPEELQVEQRWENNSAHKTLAVPLGVRGVENYVYLNLHEKAHGPHGLVAGTTGSGKSEIVQSYILSLAVNYHPYEVGFLLIDYKGGGMASLFRYLPHLLGTITNLDGAESMRAMASIKSELSRRQFVFNKHNVNHIDQYSKLFKNGTATDPMPHLFIISDEFAELKKEQPEFMSELVSAARIGRSLGIHLILATQKPSGVVDDQIWTNSKFKLALKVANAQDSNEILKTPDAANITQPGRAYLQVGNNEIYELFQSAWSGAEYNKTKVEKTQDNRVFYMNELGQGQLLNRDLSKPNTNPSELKVTQLDAVVNYIRNVYDKLNLPDVEKPWLPSLTDKIASPYIRIDRIIDVNTIDTVDLTAFIGLADIPEKQQQLEYKIDFNKDGNIAIFGASGFGKSMFLTTLLVSLAVKNSPKLLHYYILDLGNSALIQLKNLPQTAEYITFDEQVKLSKLADLLSEEMKTRKQLFAKMNAMNFDMYNKVADEELPAILWVIDNYDVIKELNLEIDELITKVTRDGANLGIFTVVAASRTNAIKYSILNNFKLKIPLYMYDKTDVSNVAGRPAYELPEIKGRCLIKLENLNHMQLYTGVSYATIVEYTEKMAEVINTISNQYTGNKIKGIPMLPDVLNLAVFSEFEEKVVDRALIPIGLDTKDVKVQYLDINNGVQLIVGGSQSGKTNLLKVMLEKCSKEVKVYLIDSNNMELYCYQEMENVNYINNLEAIQNMIEEIQKEIISRKEDYEAEKIKDPYLLPKKYYSSLMPVLIMMDDCDSFIESIKDLKELKPESLFADAVNVNIGIIGATSTSKLKGYDALTKYLKSSIHGIVLGNPNDQTIYTLPHSRLTKFPVEMGYICRKGDNIPIKIPEVKLGS